MSKRLLRLTLLLIIFLFVLGACDTFNLSRDNEYSYDDPEVRTVLAGVCLFAYTENPPDYMEWALCEREKRILASQSKLPWCDKSARQRDHVEEGFFVSCAWQYLDQILPKVRGEMLRLKPQKKLWRSAPPNEQSVHLPWDSG